MVAAALAGRCVGPSSVGGGLGPAGQAPSLQQRSDLGCLAVEIPEDGQRIRTKALG